VTTFLLVRHAAHDWLGRGFAGRQPDVSLNALGRQEAAALVQRLHGTPVQAIYSSPQPRARETAQPLAHARGLPVAIDAAFDEVDFGGWSGRTFDEVRGTGEWAQWLERRSTAQPPDGEPFAQVARRASEGLHALRERHPDAHVVVLSHGDVIKAIVATALGLSLDHLERLDIAPASVTQLELGADWVQLRLLNATGPLGSTS
jgi:broad specificity phosphatase PhoE